MHPTKGLILAFLLLAATGFLTSCTSQGGQVATGVDYVKKVDQVCYRTHNPDNGVENYRESWGSAYRDCMLQNLGLSSKLNCTERCEPVLINQSYVENVCDDKAAVGYNNATGEYAYCPQDDTLVMHLCEIEEGFEPCLKTYSKSYWDELCANECERYYE